MARGEHPIVDVVVSPVRRGERRLGGTAEWSRFPMLTTGSEACVNPNLMGRQIQQELHDPTNELWLSPIGA